MTVVESSELAKQKVASQRHYEVSSMAPNETVCQSRNLGFSGSHDRCDRFYGRSKLSLSRLESERPCLFFSSGEMWLADCRPSRSVKAVELKPKFFLLLIEYQV